MIKYIKKGISFRLQMIKLHRILRNERSFQRWYVKNGGEYDYGVIDLTKIRIDNLTKRRLKQIKN